MIIDSTMETVLPMLQAIGKIPSGIFIMTTGKPGDTDAMGMMVSSVQQVSMEPMYIAVGIRKGRPIGEHLRQGLARQTTNAAAGGGGGGGSPRPRFVLNITHAGDKTLLRKYAKGCVSGAETFEGLSTHILPSGLAVLVDACAFVECELEHIVSFGGDHDLFLAVPVDGALLGDGTHKPTVHIRHDASKY